MYFGVSDEDMSRFTIGYERVTLEQVAREGIEFEVHARGLDEERFDREGRLIAIDLEGTAWNHESSVGPFVS